ncbi:uncharacterized protein LOC123884164 isoform X2 [Trifolium pratense]|uniref:uncharacterized protein LOC123884164 isoform X2 n=1 Tax=Trifolium pratense TaxID=57577 RepID=UPI001E692268|nr:uncharacterized protein LOC123884164 isoform X2 [Trifolium pratense]
MIEMTIEVPNSSQQQLHRVASAQFRRPLLHLVSTKEHKKRYLTQCVPLHKAALKGDWKEGRKIIEQDPELLYSAITSGWGTVLHIAAGSNHVHFVDELVKLMDGDALELQDNKGNTAFCFAAAGGNVQIAEIMYEKNALLPSIRGGVGVTPLYLAALQGKSEMALYLFTKSREILEENDWSMVFLICINSGLYDLALEMLNEKETLAFTRGGDSNETGLHLLARKYLACDCQSLGHRKNLLHLCTRDAPILKLIRKMWDKYLFLDDIDMKKIMSEPDQVTFIAAEVGNFEFLSLVTSTYPDLIWELNNEGQSIIYIAILHRHANIFNLIHEIGAFKDFITSFVDINNNNFLHSVAKLAPPDRLNIVSGAALQMMLELSWFEEVKKVIPSSLIEAKNSEGLTPRELFTKEHEELLKKGESWMKQTANSCMIVSTLIATGVFSAAFSLPGGNNDNTESPNYLNKRSFLIFALSDSMALISSSTSILIFLSILISRYAEQDFLKSLPLKLISGLVALFVSIISMMVAFSSAFFITYYHGLKWVPNFISALAFLPIPLFIYLQFSLWSDIVYSAYICRFLFKPSKRMIV